jgi:hypothetical protein
MIGCLIGLLYEIHSKALSKPGLKRHCLMGFPLPWIWQGNNFVHILVYSMLHQYYIQIIYIMYADIYRVIYYISMHLIKNQILKLLFFNVFCYIDVWYILSFLYMLISMFFYYFMLHVFRLYMMLYNYVIL